MLRKLTILCLLLALMAPLMAATAKPVSAQQSALTTESVDSGSEKQKPKKPKPKPGPREEGEDN